MSYAKLGKNCIENTIAITNNQKFITFDSPIYYQSYTNMLKYPIPEQVGTVDTKNPYKLKSYYSKKTLPYFNENHENNQLLNTQKNKCSTCT